MKKSKNHQTNTHFVFPLTDKRSVVEEALKAIIPKDMLSNKMLDFWFSMNWSADKSGPITGSTEKIMGKQSKIIQGKKNGKQYQQSNQ